MCDVSKCELKGYDAVDIARRIVQLSIEEKIPLTNLKLQKLLYYAWMDYYRENRAFLYGNEIQAWPYGPVVPDAYYEFWTNVSNVIRYTRKPREEIDPGTDAFLEYILDEYHAVSNTSLKEMTVKRNTPWAMHYVEGRRAEIPFRTMMEMARSCIFYSPREFLVAGILYSWRFCRGGTRTGVVRLQSCRPRAFISFQLKGRCAGIVLYILYNPANQECAHTPCLGAIPFTLSAPSLSFQSTMPGVNSSGNGIRSTSSQ